MVLCTAPWVLGARPLPSTEEGLLQASQEAKAVWYQEGLGAMSTEAREHGTQAKLNSWYQVPFPRTHEWREALGDSDSGVRGPG